MKILAYIAFYVPVSIVAFFILYELKRDSDFRIMFLGLLLVVILFVSFIWGGNILFGR